MVIQNMCAEEDATATTQRLRPEWCASTVFIMMVSGLILFLYGVAPETWPTVWPEGEAAKRREKIVARMRGQREGRSITQSGMAFAMASQK
jgi:hypothetical protein